jgi:predicted phosphodiesterase
MPATAEVFAVEDTAVQVVGRDGERVWSQTFGGLAAGQTVELAARGSTVTARTLEPPPGAELCRIATINDLHVGGSRLGLVSMHRPAPASDALEPVHAAKAALADALAWGAQFLVVKGDLTEDGSLANWDAIGDLLAGAPVPVAVVPGNHDLQRDREIDPQPSLARHGLHLVHGVEALDLPGVRLLLLDSAIPHKGHGRVAHVQGEVVRLLERARHAGLPALVAMHHNPQRFRLPTFWPPGVPGPEARRFLRAVADANPSTLVTTGHTHRHRRHRHWPVTVTEVGSTKDYPGTWTGYVVHEGGIRQVVRRLPDERALAWTERSRRAAFGLWEKWAPGTLEDRCFSLTW